PPVDDLNIGMDLLEDRAFFLRVASIRDHGPGGGTTCMDQEGADARHLLGQVVPGGKREHLEWNGPIALDRGARNLFEPAAVLVTRGLRPLRPRKLPVLAEATPRRRHIPAKPPRP